MTKENSNQLKDLIDLVRNLAANEAERILIEAWQQIKEDNYSFKDIELQVKRNTLDLGGSILEQAIKAAGRGYQGARLDCACGGKKKFVKHRNKILVTLLRTITLQRAYYHCETCGAGYIPLDERLDILETGFSPAVREAIAFIDAEVPFERGTLLLKKLLDLEISKQKSQIISEGYGEEINQLLQEEEKETLNSLETTGTNLKELAVPPEDLDEKGDQFYVSVDGTLVNTEEGWKEVKVGAIFWANQPREGEVPLRKETEYLGSFESSEKFGWQLWTRAVRAGMLKAKKVIMIGDGAKWIWNVAEMHFPDAIQIVDWYHAVEKLWDLSRIIYGDGSDKGARWVSKLESFLAEGEVEKVIYSLQKLKYHKKSLEVEIENGIGYFQNNKERMRYRYFREQGYFIGSGVVEGGCKHIVAYRLKRSSMRWSIKGATAVLQLRLCILNKRWDSFYRWHLDKTLKCSQRLPTN